ncbi:AEC family transporter [Anaeromicropila herbilytica]|uniref:Transporter n=1 Tax=Anaeromicropila herbilytica TaxID=2785025 RepID=A0A7R7ELP8_9FIRM|nr:AEC family transporter [Anaeromicropila herbilytica]BCN31185.1 transporter [Anaeromicropila herbilytica]
MEIINTMFVLFVTLLLGFYLNKINIIDESTNRKLSTLIIQVTCPALVIRSVCGDNMKGDKSDILFVFIIGIIMYCMLPFVAYIISKLMFVDKSQSGTYQFMLIFANTSFMGFPVVSSIFGQKAIFYTSILHMGFNILVFSYGIYLISKDSEKDAKFDMMKFVNPGIISSIIALIIYFTGLELPKCIVDTLNSVGSITTPLSMLVLGASIATISLADLFKEKKVYVLAIIRLVIMPLIAYFILSKITDDKMLIGVGAITLGMPVASMAVMLSNEYEGNTRLTSMGVLVTTVLSVISIPLVTYMLSL